MKNLKDFLRTFIQNSGHFVFVSLLLAKITAFLTSLLIIRWLPVQDFGALTTVFSLFSVFAPFSGLGSSQALLRFGSLENKQKDKEILGNYLFQKGFVYQVVLSFLFFGVSLYYGYVQEFSWFIAVFFSIRLLGVYFQNHIQSELRIMGNNRGFAMLNNFINIFGLILVGFLTYFFKLQGYLVAMAILPYLSLFWIRKSIFNRWSPPSFSVKELWQYALHTSGTAVLSDALFALDILLLSWLLNENATAQYKVAILLPANITFLSLTFMQSDFPKLTKHYQDRFFLKNYILNYYKIFVPLCIFIFTVVVAFGANITSLFFGQQYLASTQAMVILFAAFLCNMLLRNLYGNLLSAVGKMHVNTWVSVTALVLLTSLALFLVPEKQIIGMAIAQSFSLVFTGLLLAFYFWKYYKKLNVSSPNNH